MTAGNTIFGAFFMSRLVRKATQKPLCTCGLRTRHSNCNRSWSLRKSCWFWKKKHKENSLIIQYLDTLFFPRALKPHSPCGDTHSRRVWRGRLMWILVAFFFCFLNLETNAPTDKEKCASMTFTPPQEPEGRTRDMWHVYTISWCVVPATSNGVAAAWVFCANLHI